MGLEITAYSNLQEADESQAFNEDGELKRDENLVQFYLNPHFPNRANEIKHKKCILLRKSSISMLEVIQATMFGVNT